MDSLQLNALEVRKMASGHFCLNLSERLGWKKFPDFACDLMQATGGEIMRKADAPDMRLWEVRIDGADLRLVFDDFPVMISIESLDQKGDAVIERLYQRFMTA